MIVDDSSLNIVLLPGDYDATDADGHSIRVTLVRPTTIDELLQATALGLPLIKLGDEISRQR